MATQRGFVMRNGAFDNAGQFEAGIEKQHIKRDESILHPHIVWFSAWADMHKVKINTESEIITVNLFIFIPPS